MIFTFNPQAKAQKNFVQGYLVGLQNDTIRGYIDDRSEIRNSAQVVFSQGADGAGEKLYKPEELKGYYVSGGKEYISRSVNELQLNATRLQKQVFLRYLVRGYANLYVYKTAGDMEHF